MQPQSQPPLPPGTMPTTTDDKDYTTVSDIYIDIENLNISTNNNDNTSINNTCPSGVRIVTVTEDTITQQFYTVQSIIPLKK